MREILLSEERNALNEIALHRIAEEVERRTGILDLRELGLTSLPSQLADLNHLIEIIVGADLGIKPLT